MAQLADTATTTTFDEIAALKVFRQFALQFPVLIIGQHNPGVVKFGRCLPRNSGRFCTLINILFISA